MYKIWYLVWIWKRSIFGFWYKAPVIRTAHADGAAARRLGRLFTFDDLFGAGPSNAARDAATAATRVNRRRAAAATAATRVVRRRAAATAATAIR